MIEKNTVAVVGMAGIFPGASNTATFWENVVEKKSFVTEIPDERLILSPAKAITDRLEQDRSYSRRACLLTDHFFPVNPDRLKIDPLWIDKLEPLMRLSLSAAQSSLDNYEIGDTDPSRIGTILAAIALPTDTTSLISRELLNAGLTSIFLDSSDIHPPFVGREKAFSSRTTFYPAALVNAALGFTGDSYTLDAACASSLYAIQLGCNQLLRGKADLILAGGVSRPDCLYTQIGFSQLRALSKSGRCSPFDRNADGLVVGEGAGIVVLKRFQDAVRDKNTIYGVIHGIGLSNDIEGNLLAPDERGQLRAMHAAYRYAAWDPSMIDLFECHGAGTPVGDKVELKSLSTLLRESHRKCAIGSVKSNIGHLLTAAGIAGVIKTILALYHKTLPPSANFKEPSDNSPLLDGPFHVQTHAERWSTASGIPPRAAVSAFGFGGINGHLLLEGCDTSTGEKIIGDQRLTAVSVRLERTPDGSGSLPVLKRVMPLAIVGMGAHVGELNSLHTIFEYLLAGKSALREAPKNRFMGLDHLLTSFFRGKPPSGAFIEEFSFHVDKFHIPPNEIEQILPQHLLMLNVARDAMVDSKLPLRNKKERMGAIIGAGFDFEASHFHFRWNLDRFLKDWNERNHLSLSDHELGLMLHVLSDRLSTPLNAVRTMGALPSIAASRIAREFRMGGPSFTVSAEEISGFKAIEIARDCFDKGDADAMLVGAVDLTGDLRSLLARSSLLLPDALQDTGAPMPVFGEGAVALVLKPLDLAAQSNDRIYAVISGVGTSQKSHADAEEGLKRAYIRSFTQARHEIGKLSPSIGYFELSHPIDQKSQLEELRAVSLCLSDSERKQVNEPPCHVGSFKSVFGNCGTASSLFSLLKTALILDSKLIPPTSYLGEGIETMKSENRLFFPPSRAFWKLPAEEGIRFAVVADATVDGSVSHVILKEPSADVPSLDVKRMDSKDNLTRQGSPLIKHIHLGGKRFDDDLRQILPQLSFKKTSQDKKVPHNVEGSQFLSPLPYGEQEEENQLFIHQCIEIHYKTQSVIADSHLSFLDFSENMTRAYSQLFDFQNQMLARKNWEGNPDSWDTVLRKEPDGIPEQATSHGALKEISAPPCLFDRKMCLEFARGSVAAVLGPDFSEVDRYKVRVRLPDEPLMLVDRILAIEGEKRSLSSGKIVTQHDVLENAWYLDGNRAPVCISVEAGQADLFLCSYLGIDHMVKGRRAYRLLDATVSFHRGLPKASETITYDITIERFVRQGETYLFFFHFDGHIGGAPLISMRNGCAGFFTEEEVENSGGIILTEEERTLRPVERPSSFTPFVPIHERECYGDHQIEALQRGDLSGCFGKGFEDLFLPENLRLPSGRMRLVHRVLSLDLHGGQYGLGRIIAEADIHPDDWFLTCHFVDDKVMPGTLMYECCAHTLRIFLLRFGWMTYDASACFEPVVGVRSVLRCRGPVTPKTAKVHYDVHIKAFIEGKEPAVIADAHMTADGHPIVYFKDMSLKLSCATMDEIRHLWHHRMEQGHLSSPPSHHQENGSSLKEKKPVFTKEQIVAYTEGNPSDTFGEAYQIFDKDRFVARLPRSPYAFLDRIVAVEPEPFVLKPGGWIEAEYDIHESDWYFISEKSKSMPFCILLEIALQPCGFLAAYMGSALRSDKDLLFRNLGGSGRLYGNVYQGNYPLSIRCRCTKVSEAVDMIIENFDFEVAMGGECIYKGSTYFGFFSRKALSNQVGLPASELPAYLSIRRSDLNRIVLPVASPVTPHDRDRTADASLCLPSKALLMIDAITHEEEMGGPHGEGYYRGVKKVDDKEWFFSAHFYMDPVCPGSLGVESFLQLVKYAALKRFPEFRASHHFELLRGDHSWIYRGQIIPSNGEITIEAIITAVEDTGEPVLKADGYLSVDGLYIYKMTDFGMMLKRNETDR